MLYQSSIISHFCSYVYRYRRETTMVLPGQSSCNAARRGHQSTGRELKRTQPALASRSSTVQYSHKIIPKDDGLILLKRNVSTELKFYTDD